MIVADDVGQVGAVANDDVPLPLRHFARGAPNVLRLHRVNGAQRFQNLITGEVVELEHRLPPGDWLLCEGDAGYGYLKDARGVQQPVWVNKICRAVAFTCADGVFLQTHGDDLDGEVSVEWVEDMLANYDTSYIWWRDAPGICGAKQLGHISLHAPIGGCRRRLLDSFWSPGLFFWKL